jgi:hypothetical protein
MSYGEEEDAETGILEVYTRFPPLTQQDWRNHIALSWVSAHQRRMRRIGLALSSSDQSRFELETF